MHNKISIVFKRLIDEQYHTANQLALDIKVSEKTVRVRIKGLNDILNMHGACVSSKSNKGYKLEVFDRDIFNVFCNSLVHESKGKRPTTSSERVPYILTVFINSRDYIKLDELCEQFYVSRNTMSADLKKVEYILNVHHLTLERRPNYGLIIKGNEFDKRACIASTLIKYDYFMNDEGQKQQELKTLGSIILNAIRKYDLHISEVSLEDLISQFYIAIERAKLDYPIVMDNEKIKIQVKDEAKKVTEDIILYIHNVMGVELKEAESAYLSLHMGAKLSSSSYKNNHSNLVISQEIDELSLRMLDIIYKSYNLDFRNNLELRMSLNQHMVPLDIRIQYGIPLSNPLLHEIKKEYAFSYTMAATACIVLTEHYHINIPEDEIGYFAILFELALEKKDKAIDKKNIVVVCSSGKGSTQLFMYKYKQAFGKYIDNIYECTAYELKNFDFEGKGIDYVFTTIPVNYKVPVPVFEINLFIENKDIAIYSEIFESGSREFLHKYYQRELFLTNINATTKEEVIDILCRHAGKYYNLPAEFYDAVMKRELMGQTDFGNKVAIPHPFQVMTTENFVTVGILRQPIWWGNNEVSVVFLISISSEEHADTARFYQMTTRLLFDAKSIKYLIDNPDFEVLLSLLGSA